MDEDDQGPQPPTPAATWLSHFNRPGVLALFFAALCFSLQIMAAKKVSENFAPFQILYTRMIMVFFCSSGVLIHLGIVPLPGDGSLATPGKLFAILASRGVLCTVCLGCLYVSLTSLDIAEATVLYNSQPLFIAIITRLLFGERFSILKAVSLLVLGCAMVMVTTDGDLSRLPFVNGGMFHKGIMYVVVLTGAFFSACSILAGRHVAAEVHFMATVWWNALLGCAVLSLPSFWMGYRTLAEAPNGSVMWLLLVGVAAFAAQSLMCYGMKQESASIVAVVSNFDIVFVLLWQSTIFNKAVGVTALLGVAVYILAVGMLVVDSTKEAELKKQQEMGNASQQEMKTTP